MTKLNLLLKNIIVLSLSLMFLGTSYAQDETGIPILSNELDFKTLKHNDMDRHYLIHIPKDLDSEQNVPLVLNFHGYGSSANEQMLFTKFNDLADKENFIVVYPQGTMLDDKTHWNVGGWTLASKVDDVGFVNDLIDDLLKNHRIDSKRIYATGMSNGGYMSFLLACQLSDKIAAIASVTGSMTPQTFKQCNPQHPMPILQLHATTDETVPYEGAPTWTMSIDEVISYWSDFNKIDTITEKQELPDLNTEDGSTVEHYFYSNSTDNTTVEHYKIINGGHDWFGARGNMDINSSEIIWNFLSQYNLDGKIE